MPFTHRRCCECQQVKDAEAFYKQPDKEGRQAYSRRCRPCQSAYLLAWNERHREKLAATKARYYRANKANVRAKIADHRARKHGAQGRITAEEYEIVRAFFHGRCAYCGETDDRMGFDHMIPFRQGGPHLASNIVLSCGSCNCSKRHRTPAEYFEWLGLPCPQWAKDGRSPVPGIAA